MKSKGVFIILGIFGAAAALLLYMGIEVEIVILLSGLTMIILGIYLLKKEIQWRRNSDLVHGKVTRYYSYQESKTDSTVGISTMYTMEAEYITTTGKLIISKEQSGSTEKKYEEGAELKIRYSREDPKFFIVEGDNSRIFAMIAVMLMGIAIVGLFSFVLTGSNN